MFSAIDFVSANETLATTATVSRVSGNVMRYVLTTNDLGDPQKAGPCGGDPKGQNEALPSKAVTKVVDGSRLHLKIQETIFHSGHYRVALAVNSPGAGDQPVRFRSGFWWIPRQSFEES
jgi:hypothetical protein